MAFQDKTKANVGFKKIVGKAHTSNSREHFNESEVSGFTLSSSRIFANKIDPTPSNNYGIVSELISLTLEVVSGANTSYVAKLGSIVPASLQNSINPLTGMLYASYDRVGNLIPESFGDDFRPILKNNGTEVPPLDSSDWFIDTFSGIVTQEDDGDSPLLNLINGSLECYIYIGDFIDDTFDKINLSIIGISGNLQSQLQSQIDDNDFDIDLLNTSINELDNSFSNSISNLETNTVQLTGSQSISGNKTFIDDIYSDTLALMSGGGYPIYMGYSELVSSTNDGKLVKTGVKSSGITHRVDVTFSYIDISGSGGILSVEHNLGNKYCNVTVIDNSDKIIIPDDVTFTTSDELTIELNSFGVIDGNYNAVIIG